MAYVDKKFENLQEFTDKRFATATRNHNQNIEKNLALEKLISSTQEKFDQQNEET